MLAVTLIIIGACMAVLLGFALWKKTVYDRILALNTFGTMTICAIAVYAFLVDDLMLLDMALLYGLVNFIATIGLLRYFAYKEFGND